MWFRNLIYELENKFPIIQLLLTSLCEFEMRLKYLSYDKEFHNICEKANILVMRPDESVEEFNARKTPAQENIPENSIYCSGCPYADESRLANLFYGYQMSGYCHYLCKGDFSFINHTDLLWDGCKECGVNYDVDCEEE